MTDLNVAPARCGFCNATGDPVAVQSGDETLAENVMLVLCRSCGAVLAALPHTRQQTLGRGYSRLVVRRRRTRVVATPVRGRSGR